MIMMPGGRPSHLLENQSLLDNPFSVHKKGGVIREGFDGRHVNTFSNILPWSLCLGYVEDALYSPYEKGWRDCALHDSPDLEWNPCFIENLIRNPVKYSLRIWITGLGVWCFSNVFQISWLIHKHLLNLARLCKGSVRSSWLYGFPPRPWLCDRYTPERLVNYHFELMCWRNDCQAYT